ncbi:MAG TPA: hypothetical protein VK572_10360 [Burkholderiales bacterium]|nr:hypothetical protein [Burkholderiales bacterium]
MRIIAALCCVTALAGCAVFTSARENYDARQVIELIAYAQKIASLPAEEQRRELNASNQMLSKDRGPYGRIRLALLLALPGTAFNDDAKAAGLLEPLAGAATADPASAPNPMQQLAGLLYAQISERLREQRRTAQLREQLDALKAIERQIIEREQTRQK